MEQFVFSVARYFAQKCERQGAKHFKCPSCVLYKLKNSGPLLYWQHHYIISNSNVRKPIPCSPVSVYTALYML